MQAKDLGEFKSSEIESFRRRLIEAWNVATL
jgi:hypothetical protein